jgi:hypothetical protein
MNINIINCKFRRQNIIIDAIMNLHYSFVTINVKVTVKLKFKLRKACSVTV